MRFKVLMTGGDTNAMAIEAQLLKERGFMVYTCDKDNIEAMVEEVTPNVVYFNPASPDREITNVYHRLLKNTQFAALPVIYTLLEDDTYLVNKKRTTNRTRRRIVCDNILDAIKTSVTGLREIYKRSMEKNTLSAAYS